MTTYLTAILLSAILFASTPGLKVPWSSMNSLASTDAVVEPESFPQLFKVKRERAWPILGENQFSIVLETTNEHVGQASVRVKYLQCSGELPLADVDFYYMGTDGQLYVRTILLAVKNLASYSLDGRIFAYRSSFAKVNVDHDGRREYIGAIFILYYYDEDGDGKFETRYGDLKSVKLPDWYKGK